MSQIRRDDNMSLTWNTRIEQNIHFPPKSYSPWSPRAGPLYHQPLSLTQNFHRTVLLCWEGWDISLILLPPSCETHRQFDYNLSNNWWFVIFNCFKIMFQMSHNQWLHPGGGTWVFFGWVCAVQDSKLAPHSRKNFPLNWYPVPEIGTPF